MQYSRNLKHKPKYLFMQTRHFTVPAAITYQNNSLRNSCDRHAIAISQMLFQILFIKSVLTTPAKPGEHQVHHHHHPQVTPELTSHHWLLKLTHTIFQISSEEREVSGTGCQVGGQPFRTVSSRCSWCRQQSFQLRVFQSPSVLKTGKNVVKIWFIFGYLENSI